MRKEKEAGHERELAAQLQRKTHVSMHRRAKTTDRQEGNAQGHKPFPAGWWDVG